MLSKTIILLFIAITAVTCLRDRLCSIRNQVYTECKNPCDPTCQNPNRQPCPTLVCTPGCTCKPGYLLSSESGKCIEVSKCEKYCGQNQEFSKCGSACAPTCRKPNPEICSDRCVPGCFCKKGWYLDESTNQCVEKCP